MNDDAETIDQELAAMIGTTIGVATIVIERSAVQHFADAVLSNSLIYRTSEEALAAGFESIPAPPTWPFAMENSGKFADLQPAGATVDDSIATMVMPLLSRGGLILHGEQEFLYHRTPQVGDILVGTTTVTDVYSKTSKGQRMTFMVSETNWHEESSGLPVVTSRTNIIHRQ